MPRCACNSYKQPAQCLKHMALLVLLVHYGLPGSRQVSDPKLVPLALEASWKKAIKLPRVYYIALKEISVIAVTLKKKKNFRCYYVKHSCNVHR